MRSRIRCKWHNEDTPSLVQRKEGWFCYGACQKLYTNKEVKEKTGITYDYVEEDNEKEDIRAKFKYINSLPRRLIRGLELPADDRGYYICWPNDAYYKYRLFIPNSGPKYIAPKGHAPPLFFARKAFSKTLVICEGELNALSIAAAKPEWSVCSLGSASMFTTANLAKNLTVFKEYSNLIVILDEDPAGFKGLIGARAFFTYKVPFVEFIQMKVDANEIYENQGRRVLQEVLNTLPRK